jgi:para-aminobenzoate synthetase/4-amino-4-deoxychorismate lyase
MKGTTRRGRFLSEDQQCAEQLRSSEKERAENLMIVDLIRNDISRIAEVGSVNVPALFTIERFETVLQVTSDVTARLRPGTGLVELFTALFPCGSVTGAPKASSMKIIRSLEPEPRGVYCGAVGLVGPANEPVQARFGVGIRTAVVDTVDKRAVYGTGGGITWDSDPAAEHTEIQAKTAVLRARPVAFQLLETMRYDGWAIHNLDRHLQRMAESADHLGFRFDLAAAVESLKTRLVGDGLARVRLLLDRDGTINLDLGPIPPAAETVLLALDDEPVDSAQWWLFHKTTLRAPYDTRRTRRPDADDVIMINTDGQLTEVTRSTLAVQLEDHWWTPPLSSGCLPGIERARLIGAGQLRERVLYPTDLQAAQALAVLSSLRGWRRAQLHGGAAGVAQAGLRQ